MIDLNQISTSTLFTNGKPDARGMITPLNIVKDMVELVFKNIEASDTDKHIKDYKFIDICCKSGNFLREIYVKLMNHPDMIKEFADYDYRSEYILDRMIYGICFRPTDALLATRNTYGRLVKDSHIVFINKWEDIVKTGNDKLTVDTLKEHLGIMKFDVVVGNPPYNNDLYLDFVQLGKKLANESVCMITPAKWQAKGGDKNEAFRRDIVPYMSDIVYYPDCTDIFAIGDPGGITYYCTDKTKHDIKNITNISHKHRNVGKNIYNDKETRELNNCLSNFGYSLIEKIGKFKQFSVEKTVKNKRFEVYCTNKTNTNGGGNALPDAYLWGKTGIFLCLGIMDFVDTSVTNKKEQGVSVDSKLIFSADTLEECEYFRSWANTRFVRFMLSLSLCGLTGIASADTWWRFVPDPGKFDHIFTDQELYEKYGLTPEEIVIIESVIKERK